MMAQMVEKMAQMRSMMDEMDKIMAGGASGSGEQEQVQAGYARARGPAPGQPPMKPGMGM